MNGDAYTPSVLPALWAGFWLGAIVVSVLWFVVVVWL